MIAFLRRWFGLRCIVKMCGGGLWRSDHNPDALWFRCGDCGKLEWMNRAACDEMVTRDFAKARIE